MHDIKQMKNVTRQTQFNQKGSIIFDSSCFVSFWSSKINVMRIVSWLKVIHHLRRGKLDLAERRIIILRRLQLGLLPLHFIVYFK